jgi:uncharacterized membrane protein
LATVLAIAYADETTAARAAPRLRRLRDELQIQPEAIAIVERDRGGGYRALTNHHAVVDGESWGMLWALLFGMIFFVPVFGTAVSPALGTLFGKIEKNGVNRAFQQQVRDAVVPSSSTLFVMASEASRERILAALGGFAGTVTACPLTGAQEAGLHEAVYGSIIAAAVE